MASVKSSGFSGAKAAIGGFNKSQPANKGGIGGFIKDLFGGGGSGKSAPTAADRPQARPSVLKTGKGKDTRYIDTKTGQSYATPEYSAFSFRGLTSSDPANVARNRYGAERVSAMPVSTSNRRSDRRGIASLPPSDPTTPAPIAPTPQELAQIGAPTTSMAPIFVDSPIYGMPNQGMPNQGMPNQGMPNQPMPGYGSAFSGLPATPQFSIMDYIDLFGPSMNSGR